MHLSHSLYRKRVRQEYQKLQSTKRSRQLSDVRTELQRNREYRETLYTTVKVGESSFTHPLSPENCVSVDLPRNVTLGEWVELILSLTTPPVCV